MLPEAVKRSYCDYSMDEGERRKKEVVAPDWKDLEQIPHVALSPFIDIKAVDAIWGSCGVRYSTAAYVAVPGEYVRYFPTSD